MDSLDLTPWIRKNDGIHMPVELRNRQELLTNVGIGLFVACAVLTVLLVVCFSLLDKAHETTGRECSRCERFICFGTVCSLCCSSGDVCPSVARQSSPSTSVKGRPAAGTLVQRSDMAGLLDSNQTPLPIVGKETQ